jgi:predicted acetyltransferase
VARGRRHGDDDVWPRAGPGPRTLPLALTHELGRSRALFTSDHDNVASRRGLTERNGSIREGEIVIPVTGQQVRRDWIDLGEPPLR